jgi:hypothetical protein
LARRSDCAQQSLRAGKAAFDVILGVAGAILRDGSRPSSVKTKSWLRFGLTNSAVVGNLI